MDKFKGHLLRCFVAGLVAILPLAGVLFTIGYFETQIAGTWLKDQGFYFFGLGMIIMLITLYLIGLGVTSILGRWLFNRFDRLLDSLPALGMLYQTLKQLVGYGEGPRGLFKRAVWVEMDHPNRYELGLVTSEATPETDHRLVIFLPNAPTPTSGRLIYLSPEFVKQTDCTVSEAMQLLVSLGNLKSGNTLIKPPTSV